MTTATEIDQNDHAPSTSPGKQETKSSKSSTPARAVVDFEWEKALEGAIEEASKRFKVTHIMMHSATLRAFSKHTGAWTEEQQEDIGTYFTTQGAIAVMAYDDLEPGRVMMLHELDSWELVAGSHR